MLFPFLFNSNYRQVKSLKKTKIKLDQSSELRNYDLLSYVHFAYSDNVT